MCIERVDSGENTSDIGTKPLKKEEHIKHRDGLGVRLRGPGQWARDASLQANAGRGGGAMLMDVPSIQESTSRLSPPPECPSRSLEDALAEAFVQYLETEILSLA